MANPAFNPAKIQSFQQETYRGYQEPQTYEAVFDVPQVRPFTISGAVSKTALLLAVTVFVGAATFIMMQPSMLVLIGSVITALIVGFIISFKPMTASTLGFVYAALEGVVLGMLSRVYETAYAGIVPQAALAVFVATAVMLGLYATRIVRVTQKMRSIVMGATMAVFGFYLLNMVLAVFNMSLLRGGPIGIAVSAIIIVIACFNLLMDFDNIEKAHLARIDARYEWYAGFGVLVTLIWMYLEMLRLLSYLRD